MITVIFGSNLMEKHDYLNSIAKEAVRENENITCNIWYTDYLNNRSYKAERIEILKKLFDTEDVYLEIEYLMINTPKMHLSKAFVDILTLICKFGDELYLDVPEFGLTSKETAYLINFLNQVAHTFKKIVINTELDMYYGLLNAETKVVKQISKNKFILEDYEEEES